VTTRNRRRRRLEKVVVVAGLSMAVATRMGAAMPPTTSVARPPGSAWMHAPAAVMQFLTREPGV